MSRIGKQPITIPAGVEANLKGRELEIKGPGGTLSLSLHEAIEVKIGDQKIEVSPAPKGAPLGAKEGSKALWGTYRSHINNMVWGVTEGYTKLLEIHGVGYRAQIEGDKIILLIGFSHPVEIKAPQGINFSVDKNEIGVSGIDKQKVGEIAARIRAVRKPEPYKGKGIRYKGEEIRRKVGKRAAGSEG